MSAETIPLFCRDPRHYRFIARAADEAMLRAALLQAVRDLEEGLGYGAPPRAALADIVPFPGVPWPVVAEAASLPNARPGATDEGNFCTLSQWRRLARDEWAQPATLRAALLLIAGDLEEAAHSTALEN
jgi:hypothetical protein